MQKDLENRIESWQREFEEDYSCLRFVSDELFGAFRSSNYRELRRLRSLERWRMRLFNRRSSRYDEWKELSGLFCSDESIYERQTACREEAQRIKRLYAIGVYL